MADFTTSKVDGNTVDASEWNQLADLDNAVTSSGQTPSTGNLNQLGIAMAINAAGADFYSDSGTANAYVLTAIGTLNSPHAYFDGMRVRFRPDNANTTGASTVNVATLGVKSIKRSDGTTAPSTGDIVANADTELRYDLANGVFVLSGSNIQATESLKGLAELATQAETDAGTNDTTIVTPLKLKTRQGVRYVGRLTASSSTSLGQSLSTGKNYFFQFNNILPSINAVKFTAQYSADGGSTILNSSYKNIAEWHTNVDALQGATNKTSGLTLCGTDSDANAGCGNTASRGGLNGSLEISNPSQSTSYKHAQWKTTTFNSTSFNYFMNTTGGGCYEGATTAINYIQFTFKTSNSDTTNGTIASGTIDIWETNA